MASRTLSQPSCPRTQSVAAGTATGLWSRAGSVPFRSIATSKHTRIEEWTLSQTGNWDNQKLDLDGDGNQADSGERDWNGTFNAVNECTARGGNSPVYDAPGNMTDDGVNYTYVYDAFGRLKTVKTRGGSPVTVSEYTYNGLGFRIGWHYDADADADVDANDPWYWFFYDERWRIVATYRAGDANPKERFVYHNAGFGGYGGSSYIDSVILRDCDDSVGWASAAPDSTLQTRYYYLQNWRADVVALIQADGTPMEYVRYSAYGVPFVYSAADVNRDGVVDINDVYSWDDYYYSTGGDAAVDIDLNRDGSVTGDDQNLVIAIDAWGLWAGNGRGFVSRLDSRKGYAGYEFDPATTQWHVRHRVLVSEMGRWNRRDPNNYIDGPNVLEYVRSCPTIDLDAFGLFGTRCAASSHCNIWDAVDDAVVPRRWRPSDLCDTRNTWLNCTDCAARAEEWARLRSLPPGDRCYESVMRLYMMYCVSNQSGHDRALDELQRCRQSNIGNGCGAKDGVQFPPLRFHGCCDDHDRCYSSCGFPKQYCDLAFLACMLNQCNQIPEFFERQLCKTAAAAYFDAVHLFGEGPYRDGQDLGCRGGTGSW